MVRNNENMNQGATTAATGSRFVVGLFDDRVEADAVTRDLREAGFDDDSVHMTHPGEGGDLIDDLTDHGVPNEHANYYAEGVRRGGHLVTLETDEAHHAQAVDIMQRHGAVDIDRRAAMYREEGFTQYNRESPPYGDEDIARHRAEYEERKDTLPVVEENVRIGKERVNTGGVRIFSRETEQPVEQDVRLRDERIDVNREKVDRPATEADMRNREGEVTMRETSERPMVDKEARVTEVVRVGKQGDEHVEHVSDTAKKRDVEVERLDEETKRQPDQEQRRERGT